MKTKITTLLFLCSFLVSTAQVDVNKVAAEASKSPGIGSLISQLGKGILPSSFADGWSKVKDNWFKGAESVTTVNGAQNAIMSLFNNLKPSAFTSAFSKSKESWMKKLGNASNLGDIGHSLGELGNGLNPSALTKEFSGQKKTWDSALGMLK